MTMLMTPTQPGPIEIESEALDGGGHASAVSAGRRSPGMAWRATPLGGWREGRDRRSACGMFWLGDAEPGQSAADEGRLARAVQFVHAHVGEVFGVEALLGVTGMPRRSLEVAFRRSLGCAPYEFITRVRVARAKELLGAPRPTKLTAIAAACGFADLRRFRAVFRRATGISPAEYRESLRRAGSVLVA